MKPISLALILPALFSSSLCARDLQPKPADAFYQKYEGYLAPAPKGLVLTKGDRLAICGDSITEQKMYSRVMEAYVTACLADMDITTRQYGWSGERADGFLHRMKNDVLRFNPNVATTCYGMNDHQYVPYKEEIGATYRKNQTEVVKMFKDAKVKVVLGSSGTIHKAAGGAPPEAWEDLNLSLLKFRNIDIEIAEAEQVGFADVYWPMLVASHEMRAKYEDHYKVEGGDGVHPGWAGQMLMATAFLQGLGINGDVGELKVDLASNKATAANGQEVLGFAGGELKVRSTRIPFSCKPGDLAKDDNMASGMALAKFNDKLNRLTLKVTGGTAANYKVTWGTESKTFTKEALATGVNLAAEFVDHPLRAPFEKIWNAVGAKQQFETKQIKELFHGAEGKADMEGTVQRSEVEHARLAAELKASYAPVEHSLKIEAQ